MVGRLKQEDWQKLLGVSALRVIMVGHPLARQILWHCHLEAHRLGVRACVASSKRYAWIPGAAGLAKKLIRGCAYCARRRARLQQQIMSELPSERLTQAAPFELVALDLFGPFVLRATAGRARYKIWVIMYICLSTRAVSMVPIKGYDTVSFLLGHARFRSIYGNPVRIYSDQGTQLKSASEEDKWQEVAAATGALGTTWKFSPVGSSWYNGLAERAIRSAREQLDLRLQDEGKLDYIEMDTLLARISYILNDRPLAASLTVEDDVVVLCPNDMLLGRVSRSKREHMAELHEDPQEELRGALGLVEEVARGWWKGWVQQVLPDLTPRTKWRTEKRNVKPGDVALLCEKTKMGRPKYPMVRVSAVHPDSRGKVRRVTVRIVDKKKSGPATREIQVGVQRLAVFLAIDDQEDTGRAAAKEPDLMPPDNPESVMPPLRRPSRSVSMGSQLVKRSLIKVDKLPVILEESTDEEEEAFEAHINHLEEEARKTGRPCPWHHQDMSSNPANCPVHGHWPEEEELDGRYGPIGERVMAAVFACSCNVEPGFWEKSPEKSPRTPKDCPNSPPQSPRIAGGFQLPTAEGIIPLSKTVVRKQCPGSRSTWIPSSFPVMIMAGKQGLPSC